MLNFTSIMASPLHAIIILSGKKYVLNKVYVLNRQVSKYMVMMFFSNNTSILTFVLTGYGFMLPYIHFMHLALLDHSTPVTQGRARVLHGAEELCTR